MDSDDEHLDRIHIRDLALRCIIGIYDDERREKQDIIVNITLVANLRKACQSDDVGDTVDYKVLKKKVIALVEQSSCRLIEHLAEGIAHVYLADPRVACVTVCVDKPAALRFARSVAVEITRHRDSRVRHTR